MMHIGLPAETAVPALLSLLCVFLLRSSAGFVLCWALARLAASASLRFALWLIFLVSGAAYWAWCVAAGWSVLFPAPRTVSPGGSPGLGGASLVLTHPQAHLAAILLVSGGVTYAAAETVIAAIALSRRLLLRGTLRHRVAAPEPIAAVCSQLAFDAGVPDCSVWLLPGLCSAASLGWIQPAIYLSPDAPEAAGSELRDVLWHEIAHVRRRDGLWDAISRLCQSLLFFHPLAGYALRALRLERELACDRLVIRHSPSTPDAYAETLVRFGWRVVPSGSNDAFGLQFAAHSSVLKMRVRAILEGERIYSPWTRAGHALAGGGACWGLCAMLPLLYVSFALPATRVAATAILPAAAALHGRPLSRLRRRPSASAAAPSAVVSAPATGATAARTAEPASPRYQLLPSAGAPMSDGMAAVDPASGRPQRVGTSGSVTNGRHTPSTQSIMDDAALGLARLAGGHDHDRDDLH